MSLEFSALDIIVDDQPCTLEICKKLFECLPDHHSFENTHYTFEKSDDETSCWLYGSHGSSMPYNPEVIDVNSRKRQKNPRRQTQVEPNQQFFLFFNGRDNALYFSDARKAKLLSSILSAKSGKIVQIRRLYATVDDFINRVSTIESIRFTARENLFSSETGLFSFFPNPSDIFGLGRPKSLEVATKFYSAQPSDGFIGFLRRAAGWKQTGEAETLVCVGKDDDGFSHLFNAETFTKKLTVDVAKDLGTGLYDPKTVRTNLTSKLGGANAAQ